MRVAVQSSIFDRIAGSYDQWYRSPLGKLCDDLEKKAIFSLADVKEGDRALDASCGTGNYAIELVKRGAKVIAVDSSKEMLKIASQKFIREKENLDIEFKLADIRNLPFPSDSFDLVLLVLGLEFVTAPEQAIKEMLRVLKPDGRLVIGILNKYSAWTLVRWIKSLFRESIWRKASFLSVRQLRGLLSQKGCDSAEVLRSIYFPPANWKSILRNAEAIEAIGHRFFPKLSAFVAIKCTKEGEHDY